MIGKSLAVGKVPAQEQSALNPEARAVPTGILDILSMPEAADIEIDFTRPLSYPRPAIFKIDPKPDYRFGRWTAYYRFAFNLHVDMYSIELMA